jgi:hypothetical protein
MKGGWRLGISVWTAALALAPAPIAAQSAPPEANDTPATDAVGPRELQNFSLSGRVIRPADQQASPATEGRAPSQAATHAAETGANLNRRTQSAERRAKPAPSLEATVATASPAPKPAPVPVPAAPSLPQTDAPIAAAAAATPEPPTFSSPLKGEPAGVPVTVEPEHRLLLWPWLIAALVAAAAGAFFLLRNRQRNAFAGGPEADLFVVPEPAPAPRPAPRARQVEPASPPPLPQPAPPPEPAPKGRPSGGVVSTGLRPWLEVAMQPVRCIVDDAKVTIEFELELYNSGTAAARAILVEAVAFNAGPTQDQEIGAFFAKPVGEGDRIEAIAPLQRMSLRTQVVAPRENVLVFEAGGRKLFVPLIAFNALYRWNGRDGQTSVSYLLGRETEGEKMAPFRIDLGARQYRKVGARPLPTGVRR